MYVFPTTASMVGSGFHTTTRAHTHRSTTTDFKPTDFTPMTSHERHHTNGITPTNFTPTISH